LEKDERMKERRQLKLFRAAVMVVRTTCALGVLAVVLMMTFPLETAFLRKALFQERDGCNFRDALHSVQPAAGIRRRIGELKRESVILKRDTGFVLWRTPSGDFWEPDNDGSLFFVLAELEFEPYETQHAGISPRDVVLDCGAHLGVYTRWALAKGAALVVAIEPGHNQLECLKRTFASEIDAKRVVVLPKGVWNTQGKLNLYDRGDTAVATLLGSGTPVIGTVEVTTIDEIVSTLRLERVDFIKMDIEGAEQQAVSGARNTLLRHKPKLAIASYHRISDHLEIPRLVLEANPAYRSIKVGCRLDLDTTVPLNMFFY
jgi:FkbM family methyltransferase